VQPPGHSETAAFEQSLRVADTRHDVFRFASFEQYRASPLYSGWPLKQAAEAQLMRMHGGSGTLPGHCDCCGRASLFGFTAPPPGAPEDARPNWREELACEGCHLIARHRLCFAELLRREPAKRGPSIYLTEQASPAYAWLSRRFPGVTGSEFVRDESVREPMERYLNHLLGSTGRTVRHEDVTALTFPPGTFDFVLTFDVLEHVPDHRAALREFARVLQPGGVLILSVPFVTSFEQTQVRARLCPDGSTEHLLAPEFHGDPANDQGILAFRNFGWDLLDEVREAGFGEVSLLDSWSPAFAVLGACNAVIAMR
jgi:SAM-dependent methyltransferase